MRKVILILTFFTLALTGCSDDDGYKKGSSYATMKIDGLNYEFKNFHTGYVPITDANGNAALSLYTRGDRVGNTPEHREYFVMRYYRDGAVHNNLRLASVVVEDTYYSEGWSMPDDAPWSMTFSKNDSDGLQATFEGVIMNGGSERVVTDGVINITYGDDNYGKGNSESP